MEKAVTQHFDAVIIGGGPGGSSAATILARSGRRVLVLERTRFPRYHIGESLIPYIYLILHELGALEKVEKAGFQQKPGFQFVSSSGKLTRPYYFVQSIRDAKAMTWQVDRARFDELLLDHAATLGADVVHGANVTGVIQDGNRVVGVRYESEDGRAHQVFAPFVVDCSGRAGFLARQFGLRVRDPVLDQLAVWRYLKGGHRQPGKDAGNIVVALLAPKGWFWWIPLADGTASVGVVASASHLKAQGKTLRSVFESCLQSNPLLIEWTRDGQWLGDFESTGDYSYSARQIAGDGWVMVGDAAAFIDPVFSSGVWMSMTSGILAAKAIESGLQQGRYTGAIFAEYEALFRRAEGTLRIFLDAFYDDNFSAGRFLRDNQDWIPEWGRVLQGDVYDDNRAFNEFIMNYRRKLAEEKGETVRILIPEGWEDDHFADEAQRVRCPQMFKLQDNWLQPIGAVKDVA